MNDTARQTTPPAGPVRDVHDWARLTALANTSIGVTLRAGGAIIAAIGSAGAWLACGLPEAE